MSAPPAVFALVLTNVVLLVLGQLLWKQGLAGVGGLRADNWLRVALAPWTWAGLAAYGLATVLWFAALSRAPLSLVYPLQSLAYVLGVAAARVFLHEAVPPLRWLGVALIVVGVLLVAASEPGPRPGSR